MRLLSYNIRFGGVGHEEELSNVILAANPDLVMLQEATAPSVVKALATRGEFEFWGCQAKQSTGFLSRLPVDDHAWHRPSAARHPFLEVVLHGTTMRVFGLHLSAWFSNWTERRRTLEIQALLHSIRHHQHGFHLIAGDFNALEPGVRLDVTRMPRWIRAMIWMSGRDIARSTIQVMRDAEYADAWRLHHSEDPGYTFPVWDPHVRLDYVFTPARYASRIVSCDILATPLAVTASDHFPLLIQIADPPPIASS